MSWVATILFCILDTRIVASYQVCTWWSHQSGRRSGPSWSAWRSGPCQTRGWSLSSASLPKLFVFIFYETEISWLEVIKHPCIHNDNVHACLLCGCQASASRPVPPALASCTWPRLLHGRNPPHGTLQLDRGHGDDIGYFSLNIVPNDKYWQIWPTWECGVHQVCSCSLLQ